MDDKDKAKFVADFEKGDIDQKLDLWFYALDQESLWDEIITEMSDFANEQKIKEEMEKRKNKG